MCRVPWVAAQTILSAGGKHGKFEEDMQEANPAMSSMFGAFTKIAAACVVTYFVVVKVLGLLPAPDLAALVGF